MNNKYQYIVTGIEDYGWNGGKKVFTKVCQLPHPLTVNDHYIIQELIGVSLIHNETKNAFTLSVTPLEDAIIDISNNDDITYQSLSFDGTNYRTENKNTNILKQNLEDLSLLFGTELLPHKDLSHVFYTDNTPSQWHFVFKKPKNARNEITLLRPEQVDGCINKLVGFDTAINSFFCANMVIENSNRKSYVLYYPEYKKYIVNHTNKLELHVVDSLTGSIDKIIPYEF